MAIWTKISTIIFFPEPSKDPESLAVVYPHKTLCIKYGLLCSWLTPGFYLIKVHRNIKTKGDSVLLLNWVGTVILTVVLALKNTLGCDEEECFEKSAFCILRGTYIKVSSGDYTPVTFCLAVVDCITE